MKVMVIEIKNYQLKNILIKLDHTETILYMISKIQLTIAISIFTHVETLLIHIQAYSSIFSTLCNPRIFTVLPYSEPWHI